VAGSEEAIEEITKIVEVEVIKAVAEKSEMYLMAFNPALGNKHYSDFKEWSVYQREPPECALKSGSAL
jgi:hypothetical protein